MAEYIPYTDVVKRAELNNCTSECNDLYRSRKSEPNCARGKQELYQVNIGPLEGGGMLQFTRFLFYWIQHLKIKNRKFKYSLVQLYSPT